MNRNVMLFAAWVACLGNAESARAGWLGASESFAVLGGTTVTSTGPTAIVGNLGVSPGTSITGFQPGTVTAGSIHSNDPLAIQAHADAAAASTFLAGLAVTQDLSGQNLGGLKLTPGVYHFASAAQLTGTLVLDAQGQANAQFIFQIGTTLTTATASSIVEINGANSSGVYFQVGGSATLGVGSMFAGTLIASESDTLATGVHVDGRIIALGGAVTLDTDQIAIPSVVPEPSSVVLCGIAGAVALAVVRLRSRWAG